MATQKKVTVYLDRSTWSWLEAFAQANSNTQLNQRKVRVAELLKEAALCIADHAGRKPHDWRAAAAMQMLMPAGYQSKINWQLQAKMQLREKGAS
jgi:hypothetical protein